MNRTYSFYNMDTGELAPFTISCSSDQLKNNVPENHKPIAGDYDSKSQKYCLVQRCIIDAIPPSPGPNYTWDTGLRVWVYVKQLSDYAKEVTDDRDKRLAATDWMVTRQVETGILVPLAWSIYRKALRDITLQSGFPMSVEWPVEPA
jgi:hypothetical protein